MPLYEYRCRACGVTHEELRAVEDADRATGCGCGAADVVRLPSLISRTPGSSLPLSGGGGGGCCGGGACGCGH